MYMYALVKEDPGSLPRNVFKLLECRRSHLTQIHIFIQAFCLWYSLKVSDNYTLTSTTPLVNSAEDQFMIIFLFFPENKI